jgi:hypothetical protein
MHDTALFRCESTQGAGNVAHVTPFKFAAWHDEWYLASASVGLRRPV